MEQLRFVKSPKTKLIVILFLLTIYIGASGCGLLADMMSDGNITEPGCIFMYGHESVCSMNASEHISKWLSTFAGIMNNDKSAVSFLYIFFAQIAIFTLFLGRIKPTSVLVGIKLLKESELISKTNNYLLKAFTEGILHPQIFKIHAV